MDLSLGPGKISPSRVLLIADCIAKQISSVENTAETAPMFLALVTSLSWYGSCRNRKYIATCRYMDKNSWLVALDNRYEYLNINLKSSKHWAIPHTRVKPISNKLTSN